MTPPTASQRRARADALWATGDAHVAAGRHGPAFDAYTLAHDLVTDQPDAHRTAHVKLLVVDRALGRRRDVFVDRLLLALAPVGVFGALAVWFRATEDYARFA